MWALFEDFVQEFYAREQDSFAVNAKGRRVHWSDAGGVTQADEALIPRMEADVLLDSDLRRIILDTKFYTEALKAQRWGALKLRSGNLYQLLAYLRNREATASPGPRHEGVLLYPVVAQQIAADIRLEGFRIRARGIDLGQDWSRIHGDLLELLAT
jgi:5-methylcytosine-specific restriction enzyme subunit McrC